MPLENYDPTPIKSNEQPLAYVSTCNKNHPELFTEVSKI